MQRIYMLVVRPRAQVMNGLVATGFVSAVTGIGLSLGGFSLGLILVAGGIGCMGLAWQQSVVQAKKLKDSLEAVSPKLGVLTDQLQSQRDAIDALAEGLESALMICDERGTIEYANEKARLLFRTEAPEGKYLLTVTLSHETEALVQRVAASGRPEVAELTFSYPTEEVGLVKAWPSPGDRVFLSIFEITELRKLELIRKDFVANVSHEMRTPMTIIRAMAETLLDEDDLQIKEKYLTKIISEVDRLSTISQDLLVLSTAESNPVRKQNCDLAEIVMGVVHQLEPKAREKGIEFTYDGPDTLSINANGAQMIQIALNLFDNAINYTADGKVSVSLSEQEHFVELTVSDTGIGISSEHLGRIFERFYRVDKARSRSTGGTGLGLSIVKHIAESHGGSVSVTSALNEGSTFVVKLPKY